MASIHKISRKTKGRYSYLVRYRRPDHTQGSRTFKRRVDAERFASTVEADKSRGEYIDPRSGRVSVADWAASWLETKARKAPKTLEDYQSVVRRHVVPNLGTKTLSSVRPLDVERALAQVPGARAERVRRVLNMIFEAAVDNGMIARNPASRVKGRKRARKEMVVLTPEEIDLVANNVPERYRTLVYLLAYGGLRWGEAAALRRSRCNLLRSRVEVVEAVSEVGGKLHYGSTKSYQHRSVAVPEFLDPDSRGLVFTTPAGAPVRNANFRNRVWHPALETAGLPAATRIHDLRHTCASLLIAQGANAKLVQAHLGHSSITVTFDTYGHLLPDDQDEIAASLDDVYRSAAHR
jgi:integrase